MLVHEHNAVLVRPVSGVGGVRTHRRDGLRLPVMIFMPDVAPWLPQ